MNAANGTALSRIAMIILYELNFDAVLTKRAFAVTLHEPATVIVIPAGGYGFGYHQLL
jgi:hypothetical protein